MSNIIHPRGKDVISVTKDFCGRPLTLEVNLTGFRSTANVLVKYGETVIMGTVQISNKTLDMDYFPLSVDYEEKFYASGKISSSRFIKREGRPSDEAILIGRIIDRPIRPLFPKGYRQEVQVVSTVLSMDPTFRPDMVAMIAASTALTLSGAPFDGPVAGLRVGRVDGKFKAFLNEEERAKSDLDLVVAGIESGITMVEAAANEVSEDVITEGLAWAYEQLQPAIELQKELRELVQPVEQSYSLQLPIESIVEEVEEWATGRLGSNIRKAYPYYNDSVQELKDEMHVYMVNKHGEDYESMREDYSNAFTAAVQKDARRGIVEENLRPDGRALDEVRQLSSQISLLPRAHGSSMFTRGVTQALNVVTIAPLSLSQVVDTMEVTDGLRRYMHHYNAPGYTVNEVKRLGSPGRREIGHGYLAERALQPVLPTEEDFPYAIRSVTEIMSQNGSTSMAAVCSSSLALMDAGVPIKRPVSGIAMGLMMDGDTPYVLTDIADAEDFAGDMDFKIAGTSEGITAIQMDMKVHGLPIEVLREAISRAKPGRLTILEHMVDVISEPKAKISKYAPQIEKIMINPDKIGAVIGKGGEMINKITSETGAQVDIRDDGLITISATDADKINDALDWVRGLTEEPEVGKIYRGRVASIKDFGAFVTILPGIDGMVHISQLSDARVEKVTDVLSEGEEIDVKLVEIDDRGRLSLSIKQINDR